MHSTSSAPMCSDTLHVCVHDARRLLSSEGAVETSDKHRRKCRASLQSHVRLNTLRAALTATRAPHDKASKATTMPVPQHQV